MSSCRVFADSKPQVWKDDDGWRCDQNMYCATCRGCWQHTLIEDTTWGEAMAAALGSDTTLCDTNGYE